MFALAAGMLLQWLLQGVLRRRSTTAVAVVPTPVQAQAPIRASGLVLDASPEEQAATIDAEPSAEILSGPVPCEEPPFAELPAVVEALPGSAEEPQASVVFELEPLPATIVAETPAPFAAVAEAQAVVPACELPVEPEFLEVAPIALAGPETPTWSAEQPAEIEAPLDFPLEPQAQDAASEELPQPDEPEEPLSIATAVDAPAADAGSEETFPVGPAETVSEAVPEAVSSMAAPAVTEADPAVAGMWPEPAPAEAVPQPVLSSQPEQALAAGDAHHLETVSLLRRLSVQRARGLHPEERLAAVFRRIAGGRMEAAAKSLRELEAFCSEAAFPSELMTTRQYIARSRDYDLGKRIDGLRARAQDEASGRRLAVAGAFLRRGRFDAVAEVLDELESDLSREVEVL